MTLYDAVIFDSLSMSFRGAHHDEVLFIALFKVMEKLILCGLVFDISVLEQY